MKTLLGMSLTPVKHKIAEIEKPLVMEILSTEKNGVGANEAKKPKKNKNKKKGGNKCT